MIYPLHFEEKLGFDQIKALLKDNCICALGRAFVDKINFSDNYELIEKLCTQTQEFATILRKQLNFPQQNFIDVNNHLHNAKVEGNYLNEEAFFEIKISLHTIIESRKFLKAFEEEFPNLSSLSKQINFDAGIPKELERVIDHRGKIKSNASPTLAMIRSNLINRQNNLRKQLNQILRNGKQNGLLKEEANLTFREGRMVIPVPAENKRQIKGFIHDQSATGQTFFIEPTEIFELNNEIRDLEYKEKNEIIRILIQLTSYIRPEVEHLLKAYKFLGMIDFIRAKAKLAIALDAHKPTIIATPHLNWKQAEHPLLKLNFIKQNKKVIPLAIVLDKENRILLVSGPNAGGKSVALKTVGLLQYMLQCGLLVPISSKSEMGIFRKIFIDIGDEQSLENDLSTYSSHLTNMKHFLKFSDTNTLFLIDEFGTGTDPSVGGAMAQAVLEDLHKANAYGVITTHYSNLKYFSEDTDGIINGAMRFDLDNLEPLYSLEIGKLGNSFAFEIAQKIGLSSVVIERAKSLTGEEKVNFEELAQSLEREKVNFELKNKMATDKELHYEKLKKTYQKLKEEIETQKKNIIERAKVEAKKILEASNQKIEKTIKEIRENQAEKAFTKEARHALDAFKESIKPEQKAFKNVKKEEKKEEIQVISGDIEVGNWVKIKDSETIGEVVAIRGKDLEVLIGDLKSKIKLSRLDKISKREVKKSKKKTSRNLASLNLNEKKINFSYKLDIRGKRAEEAIQEIGAWIDEAILLGQHELYIVHGKGTGVLRDVIRQQLRNYKEVGSLQSEHPDRGGDGVTIVKLK